MNINKRCLIRTLPAMITAIALAQPRGAHAAAPMIQYVPKNAILYIGMAGIPHQWPGYEGSNLQMLMSRSPRLQKLLKKWRSAPSAGNSSAKSMGKVFGRPFAIYLTNIKGATHGGQPDGNLGIVIRAGKDWKAVLKAISDSPLSAGEKRGHVGGIVYDIFQATPTELRLLRQPGQAGATFAANAHFQALTAQLGPMSADAWYVNIRKLSTQLLNGHYGQATAQMLPLIQKVYKGSGLGDYTAMVGGGGFRGKNYVYHMKAVMTKSEKNDTAGLKRMLALVPENAASVATYHFDLAAMYKTIENMGKQAGFAKRVKQGLTQAGTLAGISLRRDVIDAAGARWVTFTMPDKAGMYSTVTESMLRHPEKFSNALQSIAPLALMAINGARQQRNPNATPITLKATKVGTDTIYSIHGAGISWCISGKRLIVAESVSSIRRALQNQSHKNIMDNPTFAAAYRTMAADHGLRDVSWIDSPKLLPQSYLWFLKVIQRGDEVRPALARYLRPSDMPKLSLLQKYQQFSQSAQWYTPHSWELAIHSSLPVGEVLTPQSASFMTDISNPLVGKLIANFAVIGFTGRAMSAQQPGQAPAQGAAAPAPPGGN
ncbi:MAG: hypothetical protein ACP5O1_04460 [Phycisphaerae bacterium]